MNLNLHHMGEKSQLDQFSNEYAKHRCLWSKSRLHFLDKNCYPLIQKRGKETRKGNILL